MPTGQKAKSYKENMEYKRGNSWKAKLKYNVDRAPDQKHFTKVKTLGAYYAEDNILRRLEKNRHKARIPQNTSFKIMMFVQMTSYVADGNRPCFDQ